MIVRTVAPAGAGVLVVAGVGALGLLEELEPPPPLHAPAAMERRTIVRVLNRMTPH
jgi:hypothetical protein